MHNETQSAEAYIAELLNIPSNLKIGAMVAIGHPAESKSPHPKENLQNEKIHLNQFGSGIKI